ncbi:MAG: hypothetical protein K2X11_11965 [Acetobacteraceae bacterium]|nr:hypothetical protein [Acetobacteraceae bacterium]
MPFSGTGKTDAVGAGRSVMPMPQANSEPDGTLDAVRGTWSWLMRNPQFLARMQAEMDDMIDRLASLEWAWRVHPDGSLRMLTPEREWIVRPVGLNPEGRWRHEARLLTRRNTMGLPEPEDVGEWPSVPTAMAAAEAMARRIIEDASDP